MTEKLDIDYFDIAVNFVGKESDVCALVGAAGILSSYVSRDKSLAAGTPDTGWLCICEYPTLRVDISKYSNQELIKLKNDLCSFINQETSVVILPHPEEPNVLAAQPLKCSIKAILSSLAKFHITQIRLTNYGMKAKLTDYLPILDPLCQTVNSNESRVVNAFDISTCRHYNEIRAYRLKPSTLEQYKLEVI
jgi:hypothetical protein